jgi:hypothetical protein
VSDAETPMPTPEPPASFDAKSIDERFGALMETIRTWDWRAGSLAVGPGEAEDRTLAASALVTPARAGVHADSEQLDRDPVFSPEADPNEASDANSHAPSAAPAAAAVAAVALDRSVPVVEPTAQVAVDAAVPVVEPVANVTTAPSAPVVEPVVPITTDPLVVADDGTDVKTVVPESAVDAVTADPLLTGAGSDDAIAPLEPEPKSRAESRREAAGGFWSDRWTKVAFLCLGAVLVVALVVWIIRFSHEDQGSSGPILQPSTTTTAEAPSPASASTTFVEPITSAELAQYEGYAAGFRAANDTARAEFRAGGNSATVTQLTPSVTAYRIAVNLYGFQLHFIQWPTSLEGAVASDQAQIAAVMNVLQSFPTASTAGTRVWLSNFRTQAKALQLADNRLRQGLGLPSLSDYP